MDVHGAQGRAADAGLGGVVKAQDAHVLRHVFADGVEGADDIPRHKVVGTEEHVRQLLQVGQGLHLFGIQLVAADAEALVHRHAGHQHGAAEGGVALVEGLAVGVIADEADARFAFGQHVVHKTEDLSAVVHVQLICRQRPALQPGGAVHKQDGDPKLADHFIVVVVEHFDAEDGFDPLPLEGERQALLPQVSFCDPVGVHGVAQLGHLSLKLVQQGGGKVRLGEKGGGQQGDLPLKAGDGTALGHSGEFGIGAEIGKLFVAHLHGLLQDPLPGGVGQSVGIVDGLGYRVPGNAQLVRDILNGNFFHNFTP